MKLELFSIPVYIDNIDCSKIKVQSYESDGTAAGADDHIAVEFLAVD